MDRLPRDPAKKLLGFHAYRRKWATERKHLPLKDVAEAGGWLDTRSLENCYQQVDEETLLRVVSEPRKLRETIPQTIPPSRTMKAALRGREPVNWSVESNPLQLWARIG